MGTLGGKRVGAGRKPGKKTAKTLEREAVLGAIRIRIMGLADNLINSQLTLARGQTFLYRIDKEYVSTGKGGFYKNKKPVIVESQDEILNYLNGEYVEGSTEDENDPEASYYFITAKEPDNIAIDSLLDRTFGTATKAIALSNDKTIGQILDEAEREKRQQTQ